MAESRTAVELALRALRVRDRSAAELDARLSERGVAAAERRDALEALVRVGYVDDERLAQARAAALAERSSGDALIRADLEARGVSTELIERAIAALDPEGVRAERVVARRGGGQKTLRFLAARGFDEEALEALVAQVTDGAIG
ncbi:MAG: RecX family transcriptional regulator [Actinobacteria bacterium]|nr:RecX family transcriptional regulator [Actinomycetota bacterium]